MPTTYVEAMRLVLFENAARSIRTDRRQDDLEAVMYGEDLGVLAQVLIRRLTPGQLTDLGTRLLVAGS